MATGRNDLVGNSGASFPTTKWSIFEILQDGSGVSEEEALNTLIDRYWKPAYSFLRRSGCKRQRAEDLTQEFFIMWFEQNRFALADRSRGRFRSFMLTCLKNFHRNARRAERAKRRKFSDGLLLVRDLVPEDERQILDPVSEDSPEKAFVRAWVRELLLKTAENFRAECRIKDKLPEYELFAERILEPALHGSTPRPVKDIARDMGITPRQAENRLTTARRAFQRHLRAEVLVFAQSPDEVAAEIHELFEHVSGA